jgi:ribosomal-protein-alanine N-acetyltransferase
VRLPERIETTRLVMRRPVPEDAEAVFFGWATDVAATRFMSWPRHRTVEDSRAFLRFSDSEWGTWPAGPYLIEARSTGVPAGSCGFAFRDRGTAEVGYILAPSVWGLGCATECLGALVAAAAALAPVTLAAAVHPDNHASQRVLEKCGFSRDVASPVLASFPNLANASQVRACRYVRLLGEGVQRADASVR